MRAVIQTRDFSEAEYLVFAHARTASSRRRELEDYNTPLKADGIIAIKMREGDELVGVRHCHGRRRRADGLAQGPGDPLPRDATRGRWAATPRASRA